MASKAKTRDPVQCAGGCRKTVERSTMSARSGALVCPKCAARIEKVSGDWDAGPKQLAARFPGCRGQHLNCDACAPGSGGLP